MLNNTKTLAAASVLLISGSALFGWWTNHALLADWLPGIANMTFNSALMFILLGVACALPADRIHAIRIGTGMIVAVIAAMSLLQDVFAVSFGMDNLLFDSHGYGLTSPYPGRMSSTTAIGFLAGAFALISLSVRRHLTRFNALVHALILMVGLIALLGIGMNMAMGETPERFSHIASISSMTAVAFLLLSIALMAIFRQHYGSDKNPVFYAGIKLMFSLKYPQKFALISIIFATPLFMLMWNELESLQKSTEQAQLKIIGIEHIHQTADLLNAIPEHRGMLNAHLVDQKLFIHELLHSTEKVNRLFKANATMDRKHARYITTSDDWHKIETNWATIKQGIRDPLLAWRLHTEMISLLHKHLRNIGQSTQLTYDTDPTIHNLVSAQLEVLPQLFEQIGQLRGQGAGLIAHHQIERNRQLAFASMISQTLLLLDEYAQLIDTAWMPKNGTAQSSLKQQDAEKTLKILKHDFITRSRQFLTVAEAQLIHADTFSISSKAYFDQATAALTTGFAFNHGSLQYVQQRLKQRITDSLNQQFFIKSIILLVTLLVIYLFASFYLSIMATIRLFNDAVEYIRQGKSKELALLPAGDEIVHAFNDLSAQLIDINTQMSAVVDHAMDAIFTIDNKGIIQSSNPAAVTMFGYQPDEMQGNNIIMLMPEGYRKRHHSGLQRYLDTANSTVIGTSFEAYGLRKDASQFPVSISVSSMLIHEKCMFIGMIRDTSRHSEMEEELRQAQKIQAVGVLVGGVAHNFNNMLAGIIGQTYLAKMGSKDSPKVAKHLTSIEEITIQASDMVKQLLTFARKDFLRNKQDMSLPVLIRESFKTASLGISEDIQLDLQINLQTDLQLDQRSGPHAAQSDMIVHCDSNQIQQVLVNMMNNARDAVADSDKKRITVSLQCCKPDSDFFQRHPELSPGQFACLNVSDSGHGMDADTLSHVFEPFFTSKEVGSGTGLGLSSAFGTIASHQGVIEIESKPGLGTIFRVYLPLIQAVEATSTENKPMVSPSMHAETLLLVDDDEIVLTSTRAVLKKLGYRVIIAHDGRDGLLRFLENKDHIDAVITDVVMPKFNGVTMFRQIRATASTMPVIFMTGYDQDRVSLQPDEGHFSTVISKPVQIAELSQQLRTMLEKHGNQRS